MLNTLKKLNKLLLPKSLPFKQKVGGVFEKLNNALLASEARMMEDALSVLNSTIPDNANFSMDDALMWENRLGIISREGVSLDDRIKAIILKLNYPLNDAPRQHWAYVEEQLRNAGFNVRIKENYFSGVAIPPYLIIASLTSEFHGDFTEHSDTTEHLAYFVEGTYHGESEHGDSTEHFDYSNIIANHISEIEDSSFVVGDYRNTFFIYGDGDFPTFGEIPSDRKEEFRQLVLQLKPQQTVALLFINYI